MIFLGVLAVATIATAVIRRSDPRGIARWGMGIAMIVAGLAHLARPDPFEQHLPDWVPAIEVLVAATGVVEMVLGVAVLVAPGRPGSRARRATGRLTAAYLVGVFPANLYVAIAGVTSMANLAVRIRGFGSRSRCCSLRGRYGPRPIRGSRRSGSRGTICRIYGCRGCTGWGGETSATATVLPAS